MEEESFKHEEIVTKKKRFNIRGIIVFLIILITIIITFVSNRSDYLRIKEIGENYKSIFFTNFYAKTAVFLFSFFIVYILVYINNKMIKKGMNKFFEEEKRIIPKLPNKSISLIFGLIAGLFSLKFLIYKIYYVYKCCFFWKSRSNFWN